jgi:hypothetical protein
MRADDRVRLRHMVEAADNALQFMTGRQRADLDEDRMLLFAVVRAIEIFGEAASRSQQRRRPQRFLQGGCLLELTGELKVAREGNSSCFAAAQSLV